MFLLLIIEGLFTEGEPPRPLLTRWATLGESGLFQGAESTRAPEEGENLFHLFAAPIPPDKADLPLAAYAMSALDLAAGKTCMRLDFTHLAKRRDKLVFLSPERTGKTPEESQVLARDLGIFLEEEGWRVTGKENHWFLTSDQTMSARTRPLAILEGESAWETLPDGEGGPLLQRLLNDCQMFLHRHPVNLARTAAKRLPLNTPWFWGTGSPDGREKAPLRTGDLLLGWDPVLAGLAKQGGWFFSLLPGEEEPIPLREAILQALAAGKERVVARLETPAVLARHGMTSEREIYLNKLEETFLWPLAEALAPSGSRLLLTSSFLTNPQGRGMPGPVPWVACSGPRLLKKPFFFVKNRTPGEGKTLPWNRALED